MTSLNDVMKFWEWFDSTRGETSVLEIEKRGGAPRGRISNVYRKRRPSALVCKTIAKGLDVKEDTVFKMAGLLPPSSGSMQDLSSEEGELIALWRKVKTKVERDVMLDMLRGLVKQTGEE